MTKSGKHFLLTQEIHHTYVKKNAAYGDSFGSTFRELGIISAVTRMSDKWNRVKALVTGARNDVNDESLNDTLKDLANYCLMTVIELEEQRERELTTWPEDETTTVDLCGND